MTIQKQSRRKNNYTLSGTVVTITIFFYLKCRTSGMVQHERTKTLLVLSCDILGTVFQVTNLHLRRATDIISGNHARPVDWQTLPSLNSNSQTQFFLC